VIISRSYKRHLTADDRRVKEIIAACVESGAGIDFLPGAPRFRYVPREREGGDSFTPDDLYSGLPSKRGSIACGKGNPLKLKNWNPSRLDANPMYHVPMAGDSKALTEARRAWSEGNPNPLRQYLAGEAKRRSRAAQITAELFSDAA
jgi:hypothetical protein